MEIEKARESFPYLKHGKIYFNHASTGTMSTPVIENIQKVLYEKSETNIDEYRGLLSVITETKNDLAALINAKPDRIAFVDNTSNGINVLASGVKLNKGDRIILNDIEFPANVYPFLNMKRHGIEVDFVKSHEGKVSAEDVIKMIKPETKIISISQVQFLTGYRVDLEKIGQECKARGIIFSVDAIQGLGAVMLDVEKYNIDFISAGSQKWLLGLKGLGFIYISKMLQELIEQDNVGWLSVADAWNFLHYDLTLKNSAERFEGGTLNSIGIYALNASLKFFKQFGFNEIERKVTANSIYLINKLEGIGIKPVLSGCEEKNIAGIVSFKHHDAQKVFESLSKGKIFCSVREGMIRLSPHFYNTNEESDKIVDVLKKNI